MLVTHNSRAPWLYGAGHGMNSLSRMPFSSLNAWWVMDISSRGEGKLAGKVTSVTFWLVGTCLNEAIRCWKQKAAYV